jgi:hypothetical protein
MTSVLIHQATERIAQQTATIYSVRPYFLDGILSFQVQLGGSPGGFNLNASTTIPENGIGTDPDLSLFLVPTNIKSHVPSTTQESATIIAVVFNLDDTITYHVQLSNGTIVKLAGDKNVHHIDLIDTTAPTGLTFQTSLDQSHQKRERLFDLEEADSQLQAASDAGTKRDSEGTSIRTASSSEESCRSMRCLTTNKAASFNSLLNICECKRPKLPQYSHQIEMAELGTEAAKVLSRREPDIGFPPLSNGLRGNYHEEHCRFVIKCQGESKVYFDSIMRQCVCLLWRAGLTTPIVVSDGKPAMKQTVDVED